MGLKNSSAIFQQYIHTVLGTLRYECVLAYIDDLLIYSTTFEQHLSDVGRALDRLATHGLEVKASKCHYFVRKVTFLGHQVTPEGVSINPDRIKAIRDMNIPENIKALNAFIGMTGYYRNYIKGYARIIQPLRDIITRDLPFDGTLTTAQQDAFDEIRQIMISDPILAHPDWTLPWEIHCDGCKHGLGAVLVNIDKKGQERTIAYAS